MSSCSWLVRIAVIWPLALFVGVLPAAAQNSGAAGQAAPPAAPRALPNPSPNPPPNTGILRLEVSRGQLLKLPSPASTVLIADPLIADIQAPTPTSVFIVGKQVGHTTLFAMDQDGRGMYSREVDVVYSTSDLVRMLRERSPGAAITPTSTPNGVVLNGSAPTPEAAEAAQTLATQIVGDKAAIVNELQVPMSTQVNLQVVVAEVSRQITKDFGFNWNAVANPGSFNIGVQTAASLLGGGSTPAALTGAFKSSRTNISALINLLADEGYVSILAQPNLTAISGHPARFLAGGEIPIPIAQGLGSTAIEFKQFGVSLEFLPTVLSGDRIAIDVKPEVSELSTVGSVTLSGTQIPALNVRRAETTVELGSGQSFAIGGLVQNNTSTDIQQYPGLTNIPVLGPLFRSTNFQRNESELMIIVTPYLVRPVASPQALKLPTDGFAPATDLERIFQGRAVNSTAKAGGSALLGPLGPRLTGDAGFVVE